MSATKKKAGMKVEKLFYLVFFLLVPGVANAEPWDFFGNAANFFVSDIGRSIAVFVVVCTGFSWWYDKLSREVALRIAGGIICIFGGAAIVNKLISFAV